MPAARGVGTRGGTTASFSKPCTISRSTTITWRALPAEFGSWNSIWKRFWRLSRSGVFETFFEALASLSERAHLVQMFDSTVIRAHVSAAGAKGGGMAKPSGAPGEEFSTKIHLKTDLDGRYPIGFHLTGGPGERQPQL